MRFESQNRSHGEGLLRVSETTPGRGAAFSCGVFRTAGAAEAGGGRALANTNVPDSSNLSFINVEFDCDLETSPKSIGDVIKGV